MAKLKKLIKENFSVVGGVVSTPAINAGYGSLSQIVKEKYGESSNNPKVSSKQVSEALRNYNKLGETLYQQQSLKETAKSLSQIAEMAATHTVQETEDWFDKVTVSRNMKELTNHSKQFSKIAEEASSVQQRLSALQASSYLYRSIIARSQYFLSELVCRCCECWAWFLHWITDWSGGC